MENKIQKYFMFFLMSIGSSAFGMEGGTNFDMTKQNSMVKAMEINNKRKFIQCNKYPAKIIKDFNNTIIENLSTKKEGTVFFVHPETFKNALIESPGYTDNSEQEFSAKPLFDSEIQSLAGEFKSIKEMIKKNKSIQYLVEIDLNKVFARTDELDKNENELRLKELMLQLAANPTHRPSYYKIDNHKEQEAVVPGIGNGDERVYCNGDRKIFYDKPSRTLYDINKKVMNQQDIKVERMNITKQLEEVKEEKAKTMKFLTSSIATFIPDSLLLLAAPSQVKEFINKKMLPHMRENDYRDWDKLPFVAAINHFNEGKVMENAKSTFNPTGTLSNDQINANIAMENQKLVEANNQLNAQIDGLKITYNNNLAETKQLSQTKEDILSAQLRKSEKMLEDVNQAFKMANEDLLNKNDRLQRAQNHLKQKEKNENTQSQSIKILENSFSHQWYSPLIYFGTGLLFTTLWNKLPSFGKGPSSPQ